MNGIVDEVIENEDLAAEAVDVPAEDAPAKKPRKAKAEKVSKEPKAPREPKPKKEAAPKIDKYVKVLVTAAESGLREGTGRYQFLKAAESATRVSDLIGQEFAVGEKVVKMNGSNIQGMFSRGHIALSADGETWERVQTTVVSE